MAISALPTPPSTSDPSTFATKADALLSALPTFVTEANALQTDVNAKQVIASDSAIAAEAAQAAAEAVSGALKWVSGTTYGEGEVAWSPITYRSYRRKVTGAGTTDPSLDGTNWSAVASFGSAGADIASASTVDLTTATGNTVVITGTTTVTAFTMNAGQQMVLIAAGALPLTYHATTMNINGGASYTCAAGDRLYVTKDLAGVVRVNVTKQDGTAVVVSSTGRVLAQIQTYQTGAVATGTTIIPPDNTIPQNTEGDQYMSLAITPTNASSTLEIEVLAFSSFSGGIGSVMACALFQDSTANALSASTTGHPVAGACVAHRISYSMTSGTTAATTFKVRIGQSLAGTTTFNGSSGSQLFNGVMSSRITIKEYLP